MPLRKIVEIDRALCDGCGLCTTACAEGALMTVPCCGGLQSLTERAAEAAGLHVPVQVVMIGLDGDIVLRT